MSGSPEVREIVGTFGPHGVEKLEAGLQYDSRDNEMVTRRGQFHTAVIRISPPSSVPQTSTAPAVVNEPAIT
jgi:hypothetical protein